MATTNSGPLCFETQKAAATLSVRGQAAVSPILFGIPMACWTATDTKTNIELPWSRFLCPM